MDIVSSDSDVLEKIAKNNSNGNGQRGKKRRRCVQRQQRVNHWEESQAMRYFEEPFRQSNRGSRKCQKALEPSIGNLIIYVNKEGRRSGRKSQNKKIRQNSAKLAVQERERG